MTSRLEVQQVSMLEVTAVSCAFRGRSRQDIQLNPPGSSKIGRGYH